MNNVQTETTPKSIQKQTFTVRGNPDLEKAVKDFNAWKERESTIRDEFYEKMRLMNKEAKAHLKRIEKEHNEVWEAIFVAAKKAGFIPKGVSHRDDVLMSLDPRGTKFTVDDPSALPSDMDGRLAKLMESLPALFKQNGGAGPNMDKGDLMQMLTGDDGDDVTIH